MEAVAAMSRASDGTSSVASEELLAAAEREGLRSSRTSASSLLGGDAVVHVSNGGSRLVRAAVTSASLSPRGPRGPFKCCSQNQ